MNNIQVTLNLEVCGCKGDEGKAREQSERVANMLTRVIKGGGGLVVCKQVGWSKSRILQIQHQTIQYKYNTNTIQIQIQNTTTYKNQEVLCNIIQPIWRTVPG